MNDTYIHITLAHFPIVGSFIALIILFFGWMLKNGALTNTGLFLLITLALVTILVKHTGEEAEEFTEHLNGFSHAVIHEHEEAGELAFYAMEAVGVLALIGLFMQFKQHSKTRIMILVVLLGNLVTFGLMARAGKKAGYIRHTEVYPETETPVEMGDS